MTTSEFDAVFTKWSSDIPKKVCKISTVTLLNLLLRTNILNFYDSLNSGCPRFFNIDFPWLFHDQKMKIHDLLAQHIFTSKRYTTYECIPELVVTVPSARSTIVKKIKRFIIWPYKWSCHFYRIAQCSSKNSMTLSSFPMTFSRPLLFSMTFQVWKMVFLNSMTFHDQGHPVNYTAQNLGEVDAFGG